MVVVRLIGVSLVAAGLMGCSAANLLTGKSAVPQATSVPVGNQLALPPDLSLATPRQTTEAYVPNGPINDTTETQTAALSEPATGESSLYGGTVPSKKSTQPGTLDDTLERYGISKLKPDGTPKSSADINRELRAAIIAEKRRTNPGYGTVRNIGNIFSDG